jgi:hypothetical protein
MGSLLLKVFFISTKEDFFPKKYQWFRLILFFLIDYISKNMLFCGLNYKNLHILIFAKIKKLKLVIVTIPFETAASPSLLSPSSSIIHL